MYHKWLANTVDYGETKTSGACAMASAIAGLILSVNPCLTPDEVRSIFIQSCEKVGGYNYNWNAGNPGHSKELGYGRVNAYTAVQLALSLYQAGGNINVNTTWSTPKYINSNVIVKPGATLTVQNTTIKFSDGVRLIVEKGGKLIVDGAKLTSMCKNWDGIIVNGNPTLPQVPETNQGQVIIINSGIIENAMCGVRLAIPNDGKSSFDVDGGGGILSSLNVSFVNCYVSVSFAPYTPNNISTISKSHFQTNEFYNTLVGFDGFIKLNGINGLKVKGCDFQTGKYSWYELYGIKSFNSSYIADYYCEDPNSSNCPPSLRVPCNFSSLKYGIYAENLGDSKILTVKNSIFFLSKFYGSGLLMPEITSNDFQINENGVIYGLYLDNCTQYHIEDNNFHTYFDGFSLENIGLYINNSGPENNEVYRNFFTNLGYGAIANGYNRNSTTLTGLCFKCNDFSGCTYDIFVPAATNPPINIYHGIRQYQGKIGPLNTDAAGNTFSSNWQIINFANYLNPIVYVHHQYNSGFKIIPNPRTTLTVALQQNTGTIFTKDGSCPPHLQSGDKEAIKQSLVLVENGLQTIKIQLEAFTDGGNTTELNNEVQTTQSSGSFPLYEELMSTSPYLSNVVMKSGIENTAALPDAMLRDVLVANPQSAKSGEVMQALDERVVPMPEEMKTEVQEGVNVFASYDNMLGNLAYWTDLEQASQTELARIFAADTISERATDSLAFLYASINTKEAKYNLALLEAGRGNYQLAQTILSSVLGLFELTPSEFTTHNSYISLINQLNNLQQITTDILAADSLSLLALNPLTQDPMSLPGATSRNILHAAGYLEYEEPINLNMTQKSTQLNSDNPANPAFTSNESGINSLDIYPNPASDYCFAKYTCKSETGNQLRITDTKGNTITQYPVKGLNNSKVIPLKKLSSGSYYISLLCNGKIAVTTQIIVK